MLDNTGDLHNITSSYLRGNSGVAQDNEGLSWRGLLAATVYSIAASTLQLLLFLLLRGRLKRVYQPRTFLVPLWKQIRIPRKGTLRWLLPVWSTPDSEILDKCGFDAFCFIRYLRMLLRIFCLLTVVLLPSLLPVNILSNDRQPESGLDILSIANVASRYTGTRLWVHCSVSLCTILWICHQFYKELCSYVRMKQISFMNSDSHIRASCTTILIRDLPTECDNESTLANMYGCFPGGVKHIWTYGGCDELSAMVETRTRLRDLLEEEETKLIKMCQEKDTTGATDGRATSKPQRIRFTNCMIVAISYCRRMIHHLSATHQKSIPNLRSKYKAWIPTCCRYDDLRQFLNANGEADALWRKYLKPSERASIRLPLLNSSWFPGLPGIGHKVDRILHLRYSLAELNARIDCSREHREKDSKPRCAFVQFNKPIAAHIACQSVAHPSPYNMTPRMIGVGPNDVLWDSLKLSWWQRIFRTAVAVILGFLLIVLFAVPVTFTSLLNNLDLLASRIHWLSWLTKLPLPLKSVLQGLLPPLLLQFFLLLVPPTYRYIAEFQGAATAGDRELSVQSWYFVFLFTQLFLVVTISGGMTRILTAVANDPKSVGTLLASAVPKAADYFFAYLIMRGLSGSAGTLLQVNALVNLVISRLSAKATPRGEFHRQVKLSNIQWGSFWPPFTNMAVIGIALSPISPLILVFVTLMFGLFWLSFRYSILYVLEFRQDTGGLLLPAAINQTFTGLYVMELCLTGIFFMAKDSDGRMSCLWQGSLMSVGLIFTVVFQIWLNAVFQPLIQFAPILSSLATPISAQCAAPRDSDGSSFDGPSTSRPKSSENSLDEDMATQELGVFTYRKTTVRDLLDLSEIDREEVLKRAFLHPAARVGNVTVWIPQDPRNVSDDELKRGASAGLSYSSSGCRLGGDGELIVEDLPPDFSSLEVMRL